MRRVVAARAARRPADDRSPGPGDGDAYAFHDHPRPGHLADIRPDGQALTPAARHEPGMPAVTGWLAGKDWTSILTTRRVVALTFDAGANADAVPSILATLRRLGVPATFFLTGNFIANQAGYVPVRWTVDTLGWEGTAGHISASVVASRVLAAARPGEIVLMHVGSNPDDHTTFDADALPRVISDYAHRPTPSSPSTPSPAEHRAPREER